MVLVMLIGFLGGSGLGETWVGVDDPIYIFGDGRKRRRSNRFGRSKSYSTCQSSLLHDKSSTCAERIAVLPINKVPTSFLLVSNPLLNLHIIIVLPYEPIITHRPVSFRIGEADVEASDDFRNHLFQFHQRYILADAGPWTFAKLLNKDWSVGALGTRMDKYLLTVMEACSMILDFSGDSSQRSGRKMAASGP